MMEAPLDVDSAIAAWAIRRPLIAYENLLIRGFLATVAPKEDSSKRRKFSQYRCWHDGRGGDDNIY